MTKEEFYALNPEVQQMFRDCNRLVEEKHNAYAERNKLVAALSKLFPSHIMQHEATDKDWEDDWRNIVCIELPTGQCTWHIHDSELPLFVHLPRVDTNCYDGHSTEEKYKRLAGLADIYTTKEME